MAAGSLPLLHSSQGQGRAPGRCITLDFEQQSEPIFPQQNSWLLQLAIHLLF